MGDKVTRQIERVGLPQAGAFPFRPLLVNNRKGESQIAKATIQHGPRRGKRGYVDVEGRIWIRDRAHGSRPDHWDVQVNEGRDYFRVDDEGNAIA